MSERKAKAVPAEPDSWRAMLEARPLPNVAARVEPGEDGALTVHVPRAPSRLRRAPFSWFIQPRSERAIVLDPLGTRVYKLCDGQRTVEAIVDVFAREHRLTFHESRAAVTGYLKLLLQKGVIAMALRENPLPEKKKS